jgi:hypothetical protein
MSTQAKTYLGFFILGVLAIGIFSFAGWLVFSAILAVLSVVPAGWWLALDLALALLYGQWIVRGKGNLLTAVVLALVLYLAVTNPITTAFFLPLLAR